MTSYNAQESLRKTSPNTHPLDEKLYALNHQEIAFFKHHTGIRDDEELKRHIIDVQTKAYKIFPYPTIRRFVFTKLEIAELPGYDHVLALGQERLNPILLDIGCGFGHATRKAVLDGFPVQGVIASDIHHEFWDFGHDLFKSTPETFPARFIEGDVLDPNFLKPSPPAYGSPKTPLADLSVVNSLSDIQGQVSAIAAIALFHLFDEEQQVRLARSLASLLSPLPGSIITGWQMGADTKKMLTGFWAPMFCHSPETWSAIWDGGVFEKGTVRVEASLRPTPGASPEQHLQSMHWSITRL